MKPLLTFYVALIPVLPAFAAGTFTGKVTSVSDGDTLTTVDKKTFKIRLEGIDAPESGQANAVSQSVEQTGCCELDKARRVPTTSGHPLHRLNIYKSANDLRRLGLALSLL